jgi:translation initiation factor IF-2
LIIKADVAGSLKAIKDSIENLSEKEIKVRVIDKGIGNITEKDVAAARVGEAVILGFNVKVDLAAKRLAVQEKIKISTYDIIYRLIDDVAAALEGLLEPEIVEEEIGKGTVLKIFKHGKKDKIVGLKVTRGKVEKGCVVRVKRKGEPLGEGEVKILQKEKEKVNEVKSGSECGVNLLGEVEVAEKDRLEFLQKIEKVRKIKK